MQQGIPPGPWSLHISVPVSGQSGVLSNVHYGVCNFHVEHFNCMMYNVHSVPSMMPRPPPPSCDCPQLPKQNPAKIKMANSLYRLLVVPNYIKPKPMAELLQIRISILWKSIDHNVFSKTPWFKIFIYNMPLRGVKSFHLWYQNRTCPVPTLTTILCTGRCTTNLRLSK